MDLTAAFAPFGIDPSEVEPFDLTAPARILVELRGSSDPDADGYGGILNLLGPSSGPVRACSLHPLRTVGPDGCPRCWEIELERAARV